MMMRRFSGYLACAVLVALPVFAQDGETAAVIAPVLALYRDHPPSYTPGGTVDITVTISGQGMESVRALGLEERLPEGWTLVSVQEYSGDPPQIQPLPGTGPPFEFAWITPPALPSVFSYTVQVPENAWGQQQLYGSLEYRIDLGAEQAPPAVTEIFGPEPQPPRLTLLGDNPMEFQQNSPWSEPGYTALDYNNQDISAYVTVAGAVNTASPGTYTLEYKVTSTDTGLSATASRTVQVVNTPAPEPAAPPRTPRDSQTYRGESSPGTAPGVTGVPQPRPTTGAASEASAAQMAPLDLPDLSAYRPVPREKAGEGEKAAAEESDTGEKEEEAAESSLSAGEQTSDRNNRRERGSSGLSTAGSRDTIEVVPGETAPGNLTERRTYRLWAVGALLLLGGTAFGALLWRITYTPSKKNISKGKQGR